MKVATICFGKRGKRVLLAMKKVRFGKGKWNGVGGRQKRGEKIYRTARREIKEEIGVSVREKDLKKMAVIDFFFARKPMFRCHIFVFRKWRGMPAESDEMRPRWFSLNRLPWKNMWAGDRAWIPLVLRGEIFRGKVVFNHDGSKLIRFTRRPARLVGRSLHLRRR